MYETNGQETKLKLAKSLMQLIRQSQPDNEAPKEEAAMGQSPAGEITVQEIAGNCGLDDIAFYSHFEGIPSLLRWMLDYDFYRLTCPCEEGGSDAIRNFIIDYLSHCQDFLNYAYQVLGLNSFWIICVEQLRRILLEYIRQLKSSRKGLESAGPDSSYDDFIAELYAEQVATIYLMRFHQPDRYQKTAAARYLETVFEFSIPDLLAHGDILKQKSNAR